MIDDHGKNLDSGKEDVLLMSLAIYKSHLRNLINRDMYALQKRKRKMEKMSSNLEQDMMIEKGLNESIKEMRE